MLRRAVAFIHSGDYRSAAALLSNASRDRQTRNTLGVCWLRAGAIEEAVQVFRAMVLIPGSVQERIDISDVYKRNFAIALLLKGLPGGALETLAETRDSDHVMAVRMRAAIKSWERSLSFLRWLDWKINRIAPANCTIPVDFEPGEFDLEFADLRPDQPAHRHPDLAA